MPELQPQSNAADSTKLFLEFIMMQAQQIYFMLGLIPSPMTGRAEVNLRGARVYLEFLGVIKQKTRGNLTKEESVSLNRILKEVQAAYVETAAAMGEFDSDLPDFAADEPEIAAPDSARPEPQPRTAHPQREEARKAPAGPVQPERPVVAEETESKKKFVKSYGP